MEVEHINDDTVRVYIRNEDLAARGFTFIDLLGGHREIESFFYSILEEIDVDDQFKGSEAVTFQVLPRGDGLELYITKDMNFDKMADLPFFQGPNAKTVEAIDESLTEDELEAIGYIDDEDRLEAEQKQTEQPRLPRGANEQQMRDWVNRIKGETESIKAQNQQNKEKTKPRRKIAPTEYVFVFNDFEEVIQAAQKVNIIGIDAKLYELEQQFYLVVTYQRGHNDPEHMAMQNAIFKEFAQLTHLTKDVLQEHAKVLFANDALMEIKKIFKG